MTELQMLVWTEQLTMNQALMTTIIGLVVVFVVLAVLIGFIELMHYLLREKSKPHAGDTKDAVSTEKNTERISAGVIAEVPEAQDVAQDGEFIAAVSAAISVYTGKPNGSFKIKSIKKG